MDQRVSQIASQIAQKAAQDAKAAEDAQIPAGLQAAHQVKERLAEKAVEAAKAAQAALAVKVALVEEISREIEAMKIIIQELLRGKRELEDAIKSEVKSLEEDNALKKVLATSVQLAQGTASHADASLHGVNVDLKEKDTLLKSALQRTAALSKEENLAKSDLENTRIATRKAVAAASAAKANALRSRRRAYLNSQYAFNSINEFKI